MKKNVKAITCAALSMLPVNSDMVLYTKDDETVKDKTVYAVLSSDGSVDQEIASSWLHNGSDTRSTGEQLDLSNIKGMKSNGKPEISGKTYTWNADFNDIYYEGTSTKTPPVQVRVIYKLDGKEVSGKDLIGKGDKLETHISLKDTQSETVDISDRQTRIHPFYMSVNVLDLPTDHFPNVKCENGKVLSEGGSTMVTFVSVLGLQDTPESCGATGAKELLMRDDITITCEAEDFELGPIMSTITPEVPMDKLKDINSMDDLMKGLDKLTSASTQLLNGTPQFSEGTTTSQGRMQELVNGASTLTNGVFALKNDTQELVSGLIRLYSGLQSLYAGMNQAKEGAARLNKAIDGLGTLINGVDEINTNMQALAKGSQDGGNKLNASLGDEMLKDLTDGLGSVPTLQEMFEKDQQHVVQAAADLKAALTSTDVGNVVGKLGEAIECLKKEALDDRGEAVDAEAAQALKSLKDADDYSLNYKMQTTASAVNPQKQPTQLQIDSANSKNLSDVADSIAEMLPKLSSFKASPNTTSQGAQQLARGTQQLSEKSSSLLELKKGISILDSSTTTAVGGGSELYKDSQTLVSGLQRVDQGAGTLQGGPAAIDNGTQ